MVNISAYRKYLTFERCCASNTVQAYCSDLLQYVTFLQNSEIALNEATYHDVRRWVHNLLELKCTKPTVNRKLSAVRNYYKFLTKTGHVQDNPVVKVNLLPRASRLPSFIKEGEMEGLLGEQFAHHFVSGFAGFRDVLILELLYGAGLRRSELMAIHDQDIDFEQSCLIVQGKRSKQRIVPLGHKVLDAVREYVKHRGSEFPEMRFETLLLTDSGNALYPSFVYRKTIKYLGLATTNIKRNPHVLRHTYATHLLNNGAGLSTIKDLLGHESLAATQVYAHNSFEQLFSIYKQAHPRA